MNNKDLASAVGKVNSRLTELESKTQKDHWFQVTSLSQIKFKNIYGDMKIFSTPKIKLLISTTSLKSPDIQRGRKMQPILRKQKNQSSEIDPEVTQMIKLVGKNIRIVIVAIFHMFKKLEEN